MSVLSGIIDPAFAVFHLMFWRLFGWPARLEGSGRINAAITQTLNIVLIYAFATYGSALIWLALSGRAVPSFLVLAGAGFWALRAALQPLLFPMKDAPSAALFAMFMVAAKSHAVAAL